jgi:hypothetical protein
MANHNDLPEPFRRAIGEYNEWADEVLRQEQEQTTVHDTLYHYTDGPGLVGILSSQTIRLTDYRHMNDPSELRHGLEVARDAIRIAMNGADAAAIEFLRELRGWCSPDELSSRFEFFTGSFSRKQDDLGQWRAYADNGRGYAIGFAPHVFAIEDRPDRQPNESIFVAPVRYDLDEVMGRHEAALERGVAIYLQATAANPDIEAHDREPFKRELAIQMMAAPLIWNCLTSKHEAYAHEHEVRLILPGTPTNLAPYIATRLRGSELVPYAVHHLPRQPHNIGAIVTGPTTSLDSVRTARTLLRSLGYRPDLPVSRSLVPYRG